VRLIAARLLAVALGMGVVAACGGEPPRAPTPLRPIDQGHAVVIVARAMKSLGFDPERGRTIHVANATSTELKELTLDVAAKGKKWGIAYITNADGEALGDALPKRKDPERFTVIHGVGDGEEDTRAVLLFAGDYMEDDLAGEAHTSTSIAAEDKLRVHATKIAREAHDANWP
jgi:hypothetical protein